MKDNVVDTDKDIEEKALKFKEYLPKKFLGYIKNWYFLLFIILLIVVFITRLKFLFVDSIWNDETVYMWNAVRLLMEPSYLFSKYFLNDAIIPQFIIAFFKIFTTTFNAGRLMALFYSIFGIISVYLLGKEVKNEAVGLIATILISFNHIYWFIGSKTLIDAPIAAMIVFSAYCLLKFEKKQNVRWAVIAGISSILPIITKGVGSLVLFIFPIYFLITRHKNILKDRLGLLVLAFPVGVLTLGNLIYFIIIGKFFTTNIFSLILRFSGAETPFNFTLNLLSFVLNWWVSPFLILGVILAFVYRKREDILLLVFFFVYLLFTEFSLGRDTEVIPRFLLTVLPIAVVFVAKTFSEIVIYLKVLTKVKIGMWIFVIIAVIMAVPFYNLALDGLFNAGRNVSFSGYQEGGDWLKNNAEKNALIYATAPRQIRAFAEREYIFDGDGEDRGGTLSYISSFKTIEEFGQEITNRLLEEERPIYIYSDLWESGQPDWITRLDPDKAVQLEQLGFMPVYVVERDVPTNTGFQKAAVGIILKKNG